MKLHLLLKKFQIHTWLAETFTYFLYVLLSLGGTDVKEEVDNCSTTRSQKGDEIAADDSSFPPRKRKLRNKTEQQTHLVSTGNTTSSKTNQPLEKPPNPYETYLNLRRRVTLNAIFIFTKHY